MAAGVLDKLPKVEGLVGLRDVVVEQAAGTPLQQSGHFLIQQRLPWRGDETALRQEFQKPPRLLDAMCGVRHVPRVIEHHLAQHLVQVPAGVGVVADVGDTLRSKPLARRRHQTIAHLGGHP